MKERLPHKYDCMDNVQGVLKSCSDNDAKNLIKDLCDLIIYQKDTIKQQRVEIIALKHRQVWDTNNPKT